MPSWGIHLAIATKLYKKMKVEKNMFLFGNILPDINNGYVVKEISKEISHKLTHYEIEKENTKKERNYLENCNSFYAKYKEKLDNPLVLGYLIHLLTDYYWNNFVYQNRGIYKENKRIGLKLKSGESFFASQDECRKLKTEDFKLFTNYVYQNAIVPNLEYNEEMIEKIVQNSSKIKRVNITSSDVKNVIKYLNDFSKSENRIKELDENQEYKIYDKEEYEKAYKNCITFICNYLNSKKNQCPQCGSCNMKNANYQELLKEKTNNIKKLLQDKVNKDVKIKKTIGMVDPYNYRNKGKYAFGIGKNNKILMGFYKEGTHDIIPNANCNIQADKINEVASFVYELVKKYKISIYNEDTKKGILRHLVVRIGKRTGEIMVILVTTNCKISRRETLVKELTARFPEIKTIVQNINEKTTSAILGDKNIKLYGNGYIYDFLGKYKFKISPLSFYQVNSVQTEILYNKAIEYAKLDKGQVVYDLYCGIGTISLFIAQYVKKVYAIESVSDAVRDAKENCKINRISNANFTVGRVENVLPKLYKQGIIADVVFVDPPRSGLDNKTMDTILNIRPKKIVYISCNPNTLSENIEIFNELYDVIAVQPVDMFPFTNHVECVVVLSLKQS